MKKSDIENFEIYLDSYLNILKKIKQTKLLKNKTSLKYANSSSVESHMNRTNISNHNIYHNTTIDKKVKIGNLNGNDTAVGGNSSVRVFEVKSYHNETFMNSTNLIKPDLVSNAHFGNKTLNNTEKNLNKTINEFFLNSTEVNRTQLNITHIIVNPNNISNNKNTTSIKNITTKAEINIIASNKTKIKPAILKPIINTTVDIKQNKTDDVYENLKTKTLNEEFERRETDSEVSKQEKLFLEEENAELNIYKRIVNISLSLIVVGLIMGILMGLILVMYFNSKN